MMLRVEFPEDKNRTLMRCWFTRFLTFDDPPTWIGGAAASQCLRMCCNFDWGLYRRRAQLPVGSISASL
jgi:hypothetical protein